MHHRQKYDWFEWFTNERTTIRRGVDYQVSQSTMGQMIRNNASKFGIRVRVIDTHDAITIEVLGAHTCAGKTSVTG